jgi:hypothetical protein
MQQLSFKEYLESKQKLLSALKETPVQTITYEVNKYCKLVVGEKDAKEYIALKPSQKIIVEWRYDSVYDPPIPVSLCFENVKTVDSENHFNTFWTGIRLKNWLSKNTSEQ